jgi:acetylglutamate kinase
MNKLHIIKVGGKVLDDGPSLEKFLDDLSGIRERKIVVHGGGKLASELAEKLGISQAMVNGRRITDAKTLEVVTMVYAGLLNKRMVALLQARAVNALGLSGADLNSIRAHKRQGGGIDFGYAGDIDEINVPLLAKLVEEGLTLVFCPITHDSKGQLFNTNADTIAAALAISFSERYEVQLNYCFEKKGVMNNVEDAGSLIPVMTESEYRRLLQEGAISQGMIPKLDNSFAAIVKGVSRVVIGDSGSLSEIIQAKEHCGTILTA